MLARQLAQLAGEVASCAPFNNLEINLITKIEIYTKVETILLFELEYNYDTFHPWQLFPVIRINEITGDIEQWGLGEIEPLCFATLGEVMDTVKAIRKGKADLVLHAIPKESYTSASISYSAKGLRPIDLFKVRAQVKAQLEAS